jgi:hypothetical protein
MAHELSKAHASSLLRAAGFAVESIPPEPPAKRADLRAWHGHEEYVIEAKEKEESEKWLRYAQDLDSAGSGNLERNISPWRSIASVIEIANGQLRATPASDGAFRLIWLVSVHDDDEFVMECVKVRLLGVEIVNVMEDAFATKRCFYHNYSDFRRYPEIDGAVLSIRKGSQLCVNSFSPRSERFSESQLYKLFAQMGSLCDPSVLEARGEAFLIGNDFTGKPTGREQWAYLLKKYGVHTSVMKRSRFDAGVILPINVAPKSTNEASPGGSTESPASPSR